MFLIDKVAFTIGGIEVRWYGIIIAFGALLAALLATRVARIRGENPDQIWQVFPWALIGGIIGARVGFFVAEPSTFKGIESLNPLSGGFQGLSIQGAMVGGILACLIYCRLSKLSLFRLMDIAAPGIAMAQGIGRLGNFVNQEAYGAPCADNNPFCVVIDPANRKKGYENNTRFQPTFAYEMGWDFINAILVYWLNQPKQQKRFDLRDGDVFWIYAIIYSIGRFVIEGIRVDSAMAGDAKVPQLFAIATIVVAFAFIAFNHRTRGAKQLAAAAADGRAVTFTSGGKADDFAAGTTKVQSVDEASVAAVSQSPIVTTAIAASEPAAAISPAATAPPIAEGSSVSAADEAAAAEISAEDDEEGVLDEAAASDTVEAVSEQQEEEAAAAAAWTEPQMPVSTVATALGGTPNAGEVATGQHQAGALAADEDSSGQ